MVLRQLEYLVALAAKAFRPGRGGLSRHATHAIGGIRQLEQDLGAPIIERGTATSA